MCRMTYIRNADHGDNERKSLVNTKFQTQDHGYSRTLRASESSWQPTMLASAVAHKPVIRPVIPM